MIFGKTINKYYIKYGLRFIIGIVTLFVVDYAQLLIPGIIKEIVDGLTGSSLVYNQLIEKLVMIILITVIVSLGRFLWRQTIIKSGRLIERDLKNKLFDHQVTLSQEFYSKNKTGALLAYYNNDIETVIQTIIWGTIQTVDTIFLGVMTVTLMLRVSVSMTILAIVPLALISLVGFSYENKFERLWDIRQKAYEKLSDFITENYYGIAVVKAFVKQKEELKMFRDINKKNYDSNVDFQKLHVTVNSGINIVIYLVIALLLLAGSYLVTINPLVFTVGSLIMFISLFENLIYPFIAIPEIIVRLSQAKASLKRIDTILDEKSQVLDDEYTDHKLEKITGDIVFHNLNFAYPDDLVPVLKDISFTINEGETVGIIGKTGSGKTTFVEMLLRTYNPSPNMITIGGVDIRKIPLKVLRENFGYVPQDGFLFNDLVKNNIGFSIEKDCLFDDLVFQAAKDSCVDSNIRDFKDEYDTLVGERGVTLSGGQRQRIAIARALVKNPDFLILDDSVSAVDTGTEEAILENLKRVRKDKTTIIIAHRISTIKNADKIVLIDHGEVSAIGTHEELLISSEIYQDIVDRQKLSDEIGGEI